MYLDQQPVEFSERHISRKNLGLGLAIALVVVGAFAAGKFVLWDTPTEKDVVINVTGKGYTSDGNPLLYTMEGPLKNVNAPMHHKMNANEVQEEIRPGHKYYVRTVGRRLALFSHNFLMPNIISTHALELSADKNGQPCVLTRQLNGPGQ